MMDHERASELLGPLLRGELDAGASAGVEAHLATCEECAAERRSLVALLAPLPDETMNDLERARLHSELASALPAPGRATPGVWPAVAKWMGAAATITLLAFGVTQLDLAGDDSGDAGSAATLDSGRGSDDSAPEASAPLERGGPNIADQAQAGDTAAAAGQALIASEEGSARVAARFDNDAGTFRSKDLKAFAAAQAPFTTFAQNYSTDEASSLSAAYVNALERAVAGARAKATIRACAELVLEQEFPIVPAYGAYGRFEGRDVLVLGFVFAPPGGDLNNYLVWVWPRDNCDTPVKVLRGRIVR